MFEFKQFKTMLQNTVKLCSISHFMVHSLLWHWMDGLSRMSLGFHADVDSWISCIWNSRSTWLNVGLNFRLLSIGFL